jgi:hypothetical protein
MAYFKNKNLNLGKFLEGLEMEDVGIFYVRLVYFTAILVYFSAIWYTYAYFPRFGMLYQKNLATLLCAQLSKWKCFQELLISSDGSLRRRLIVSAITVRQSHFPIRTFRR